MDNKLLHSYTNGNSQIKLYENGTRIIEFEDEPIFEWPLNIDIRISNRCSLGYNPKTKTSVCDFCHESATTDGNKANLELLKIKLKDLPAGIELAIGGNEIKEEEIDFFKWCQEQNYIVNLTINQHHIKRDKDTLIYLISNNLIKGLGISLRDVSLYEKLPEEIKNYSNSVLHVIAGLDDLDEVLNCSAKKVLILGYKTFGKGTEYFENNSSDIQNNIYYWYTNFVRLVNKKYLSFDNLALTQLNVKRWINPKSWETFHQGEHSMYINAVDGYYSPSSRSSNKSSWTEIELKDYYNTTKTLSKE